MSALVNNVVSRNRTVGVLLVDPSSSLSGGALLGDRVRMLSAQRHGDVFIRSMAARGNLGGLASATPIAVDVLDAAGFDVVIVETVGVGQSEVEVAFTADTTAVVLAPNTGDGIQALKAGVMEIADVFVVNKSDLGGAEQTEAQIRRMLASDLAVSEGAWRPSIVRTSAVNSTGINELADCMEEHASYLALIIHGVARWGCEWVRLGFWAVRAMRPSVLLVTDGIWGRLFPVGAR